MVKSMTGYGRAEDVIDGMQIAVEMKSVNSARRCREATAFWKIG